MPIRDLTQDEKLMLLQQTCPFCAGQEFHVVARGGLSTNRRCSNPECGAVFNTAFFQGWLILAELLGEPKRSPEGNV